MVSEEKNEQLTPSDMTFCSQTTHGNHWEYDTPMYLAFLDLEKAFGE